MTIRRCLAGAHLTGGFVVFVRQLLIGCLRGEGDSATSFLVEVHGLEAAPQRSNMQISLHDDDDNDQKKLLSRTSAQRVRPYMYIRTRKDVHVRSNQARER